MKLKLPQIHIALPPLYAVVPVGIFVVAALTAPLIATHDPSIQDLMSAREAPSLAHWLGTDHLGRDTFSRIVYGARTTLFAVGTVVLMAMAIGVMIGLISGYVRGILDELVMRFIDFGLSIPSIIVALAVIGVFGPGYWNMILALTIAWVPIYARLTRAIILAAINQPHIEALRVLGARPARIVGLHLFPQAIGAVVTYASADAGVLALAIATLSFLGLGIQPPTPEWGQMLVDGLPYLAQSPQQVLIPGIVLTAMVVSFNLLGEALALGKTPRPLSRWSLRRRRAEALQKIRTMEG